MLIIVGMSGLFFFDDIFVFFVLLGSNVVIVIKVMVGGGGCGMCVVEKVFDLVEVYVCC